MPIQQIIAILAAAMGIVLILALAEFLSSQHSLDGIKAKTVGNGQHGTARWATRKEIHQSYTHVPFTPELWRKGQKRPKAQGLVVFYCDELGTIPPIQSLELMFSASRSRGLMPVPIVQSITGQLQKNYGKEGGEVIVDNCQLNIFGGFAPASQTAVEMSKALGSRTVMSGSVSRGRNDPSWSLQMMERPLMTSDELKAMPKGEFIVMKTGVHPMQVRLRLFLDWGIRFGAPYQVPEHTQRPVAYASRQELEKAIRQKCEPLEETPPSVQERRLAQHPAVLSRQAKLREEV